MGELFHCSHRWPHGHNRSCLRAGRADPHFSTSSQQSSQQQGLHNFSNEQIKTELVEESCEEISILAHGITVAGKECE
jgi:hypothetical protein